MSPQILSAPTITCGYADAPVAVIATYKGKLYPVSGAYVRLILGSLPLRPKTTINLSTDIMGMAQTCVTKYRYVEAGIMKGDIDFGKGKGAWYKIGSVSGTKRGGTPFVFKVESKTLVPGLPVSPPPAAKCFGSIVAKPPDISGILSQSPMLPSTILVPITTTVRGAPGSMPIAVYADSTKIGSDVKTSAHGMANIDIINITRFLGMPTTPFMITLKSTLKDCNVPDASFPVPAMIPMGAPLPGVCKVWNTAASPNIPSILQAPFTVGLSDAGWICSDTGEKTPVNATGVVDIGGHKFNLPISGGFGSISLNASQIQNIISGVPSETPYIPPEQQKPIESTCPQSGRFGVRGQMVSGSTLAKINSCLDPGYRAEAAVDRWTGAVKVYRPNRSYYYAIDWGKLFGLQHYGGQ